MKIIAVFCIVVVHSGTFPEFGYLVGGLLENCTRWALPFFFLTSGFMLGLAREINLGRKVNKILHILFWSSIIYLPIIFIKSIVMHDSFIERIVNLQTFFGGGVYFYLWFLISLIVAFLFVNYFSSNLKITQALSISFVIILLCWITDLLRSCGIGHQEFYLFRL
ncbi:TPA: hypothetical protein L9V21_005655, partial [Klebsiella pneumoniae]|nr:hypothetical protein [Klebsiella pneumoniae]HBR4330921.1 hypothetical protein [Klebsiella pneumoniae]